jgi:subtilisin family serine protease
VAVVVLGAACGGGAPTSALHPAGAAAVVRPPAFEAIGLPPGSPRADGSGVVVAVVDSGVDAGVRALRGRVDAGVDVVSGGPASSDERGHGTGLAVLVAGDGSGGGLGVAPGARILPVRVLHGRTASAAAVAEALRRSAGRAGVILLAYAPGEWPADVLGAVRAAHDAGAVVVVSAGNRGALAPVAPVADHALVVAAVDRHGALQRYSGRAGPAGVAAPGGDPDPSGDRLSTLGPGGTRRSVAGTSASAALVAGVVALVRSASPGSPADAVLACVRRTAADLGPPGPDDAHGFGMIDAGRALACATAEAASAET